MSRYDLPAWVSQGLRDGSIAKVEYFLGAVPPFIVLVRSTGADETIYIALGHHFVSEIHDSIEDAERPEWRFTDSYLAHLRNGGALPLGMYATRATENSERWFIHQRLSVDYANFRGMIFNPGT